MAHQITVSWTASPPPVTGYNIRRGTAPSNEGATPLNGVTPIVGTSYVDTAVFPGVTYSYEVTAVNNGVESAESIGILSAPVPFDPSPASLDGYLGTARSFSVLGASAVTNTGTTLANGDVGVSPGTSITGFGPPSVISGVFHSADFVAAGAQTDLATALAHGQALSGGTTVPSELGGMTLAPGIYKVASSQAITGNLVLHAGGNPDAVWIFQIGSTLTTAASNSAVVLAGGAKADNVYWLVGSSATLGVGTSFAGNVLAAVSITANTGALLASRLLASTGAVTLQANDLLLTDCSGANLPPSGPNTPPPPPAAPTGVNVSSEA